MFRQPRFAAGLILGLLGATGVAVAATQTWTLGSNTGPGGIIKMFGSASGDVTIQPAAAAGTATLFQLPANNGTNAFVLQTDGSGVTSWVAQVGGSGCTVSGSAGIVLNNGSNACTTDTAATLSTGALSLGSSGVAGSVAMGNATTGTVTLQPVTGALGSVTASLPANTGTIAELNLAQSFTAAQTFATELGTNETVTLTSNDYVVVAADCGKVKLLPTGTSPTVHLANLNQTCSITFITTATIAYQFLAASGGSTQNSQGFTHTRGTAAGDTVSVTIVTPSSSAAKWNISGDLTS